MAIIIGNDPKVEHSQEHFDAKEQWDLLPENTQLQMQITAANLMKESSQDPLGLAGGIPPSMDDSMFDISTLASPSFTMNEQNMSLNMSMANENIYPKGIDDICLSDLNTPDIRDLEEYVFPTDVIKKTSPRLENSVSKPTNINSKSTNFMRYSYSPEILSDWLKKFECIPEQIFDSSSSDEKTTVTDSSSDEKMTFTDSSSVDQLVLETHTPVDDTMFPFMHSNNDCDEHKVDFNLNINNVENNQHFINSQTDKVDNPLPTINYEDILSQKNVFSTCFQMQNEILDKDEEEQMVNSFLNMEEEELPMSEHSNSIGENHQTSDFIGENPVCDNFNSINENIVHNNEHLNSESILKIFKEIHGESGSVIGKVKFIIPKKKVNIQIPPQENNEPIIVTVLNRKSLIKNDYLYNTQPTTSTVASNVKVEVPEASPSTSNVNRLYPIAGAPSVPCKASKRKIKAPIKYENEITSDLSDDEIAVHRPKKRGKFSLQGLTDAEKYQRIRQQNNVASKKCRDKKKIQQQSRNQDLQREESRNKQLIEELRLLENRIRKWKELNNSVFGFRLN